MSLPNRQQWFIIGTSLASLVLIAGIAIFFITRSPAAGKVGDTAIKAEWVDKLAAAQKTSRPRAMEQIVQAQWDIQWAQKHKVKISGSSIIENTPQYAPLPEELKALLNKGLLVNSSIPANPSAFRTLELTQKEKDQFEQQIQNGSLFLIAFKQKSDAEKAVRQLNTTPKKNQQRLLPQLTLKYAQKTQFFISQQASNVVSKDNVPKPLTAKLYRKTFVQQDIDALFPKNSPQYEIAVPLFKDKSFFILAFNARPTENDDTNKSALIQAKLSKFMQQKLQETRKYQRDTTCKKEYYIASVCSK